MTLDAAWLHSWHFTVLWWASGGFTHLRSTPAPPGRNPHPFVVLLVGLWQKHKWMWPNLPGCGHRSRELQLGLPAERQPLHGAIQGCRGLLAAAASSLASPEGAGSHAFGYAESQFSPLVVASAALAWHDAVWAVDNFDTNCATEKFICFIDEISFPATIWKTVRVKHDTNSLHNVQFKKEKLHSHTNINRIFCGAYF